MILIVGGYSQGKYEFAKKKFGEKRIALKNINSYANKLFLENKDIEDAADMIIKKCYGDIIITDEIGNGIIPLEKDQRDFRDWMGRVQVLIADRADEVIRVISGLGQKIK